MKECMSERDPRFFVEIPRQQAVSSVARTFLSLFKAPFSFFSHFFDERVI
jgi:hypothetical protein